MKAISRRAMTRSAFAALCLCVSAGASEAEPAWMIGTWTGTGSQTGTSSHWTIQLAVQRQADGALAFKIDYPSLNCGGYWTLIGDGPANASLTEHITYGRQTCVDLGTITVTPKPANGVQQMSFVWTGTQPNGKSDYADAVLTRTP
jgi:hypothetical protein